jgi:hypothetical protein
MDELELMEQRLHDLEKSAEQVNKEVNRLQQLRAMPFHKRIQEPELRVQLDGFKARQKEAFLYRLKKEPVLVVDNQDKMFNDFFEQYLEGKVSNIAEYFK